MAITITTEQTIDLTVEIVAKAFFEMDNEDQQKFFNFVAKFFNGRDFDIQMSFVANGDLISEEGLEIMATIGKHSTRK